MQAETRDTPPPGSDRDIVPALDMAGTARLRRQRWREPPRGHRLAWLVLLVTALLHLGFSVLVWWAMRPLPPPPHAGSAAPVSDVLEVRFIPVATAPAAKAPPPPAPLPSPPPRTPVVKRVTEPAARHALTVELPAPAPAASVAAPRLYDRNGQIILPPAAGTPVPDYVQRQPLGDTRIMQHDSPVKYQATRFDKDWGSGSSNAIDDALQKAVDKTTVKHTFHLPGGIHIHCGVSLAALAGGCGGDPPPPPPPKDGDVRLNMAPAKPLAPNPDAPKPPPLSTCIALYRAGKSLADGCPSDTPIRAVDEELQEQRAKQHP